jgi:dTDP-4-dehydrorhamnose 3,5-epimerase
MSRLDLIDTAIQDLKVVQRKPLGDSRGFLSRMYCAEIFMAFGVNKPIAQINHTLTQNKGTVRGLHFQYSPYAETKLVSCIKGEVFDVAVDLRKNSPTFLKWHAEILSADNHKSLLIPEGFAHGFQTLTDNCELIYLHTESYQPSAEGALNVLDCALKIKWPLDITELSERDRKHAMIDQSFQGLVV